MANLGNGTTYRARRCKFIGSLSNSILGGTHPGLQEGQTCIPQMRRMLNQMYGLDARTIQKHFSGRYTGEGGQNFLTSFPTLVTPNCDYEIEAAITCIGENDSAHWGYAQTTTNIEAIWLGLMFGALGVVRTETDLPPFGDIGRQGRTRPDRYVALSDSASSGGTEDLFYGMKNAPSAVLPTLTGSRSGVLAVWEKSRPNTGGTAGYRRVATIAAVNGGLAPTNAKYILAFNAPYLNFSDGSGDITLPVVSITQSGGVATLTLSGTSTGFANSRYVTVTGANQSGYNLDGAQILSLSTGGGNTVITFAVNSGTATPATATAEGIWVTQQYGTYNNVNGIRKAQNDAVAAFSGSNRVFLIDQWNAERQEIVSGATTQGSAIYQILPNGANAQHRSKNGHTLMAREAVKTVVAIPALVKSLKYI